MKIKQFFTSKRVWTNLIAIVVLIILLVFGTMEYLKVYTRHGKTIEVPNFKGLQLNELEKYTAEDYFEFVVIDSVYDSKEEKGSIIDQDPSPHSTVKKGRKIYLSIVALQPEKIKMPDVVSLSLRQAKATLESYGLKIASLEYVASPDRNAVLRQEYLGNEIKPGEKIETGSAIKLILGRGNRKEKIDVPFLIGLKKQEAIDIIYANSLNLGQETYYNPADTSGVKVYLQHPKPYKNRKLGMGDSIDLVYRNDRLFNYEQYIKQYKKDSLRGSPSDTLRFNPSEK